jgi:tartrate dehydratase beta subunit/fumarate hydratase class I family protein
MSLHNSRFEQQQIVNSFNLFLDSEKSTLVGDTQSEGDAVKLHFEGNSIEAGDGEIIRLSLLNFTMYNNIYHINGNNNTLKIFAGGTTSAISADAGANTYLTPQYIERLHAISTNFGNSLIPHLKTRAIANGATTVDKFVVTSAAPLTSYQMQSTGTRLLDVTLEAQTNADLVVAHALTNITIQCIESEGDSYAILGGNRLDGTPAKTDTSFKITVPTTSTIRIQGYYPMQRTSDPYVYIRCNQAQTGLEMSVLQKAIGGSNVDVVNSNVLAKAFRQVEFIHYDSATGEEYFMNLQTKKLSNLDIFLTDSKGRHLGRRVNQMHNKTASGLINQLGINTFDSDNQSTQGNLFFTGVVRVDIVKVRDVRKLETPRLERPSISSKASGIVTWENGGLPRY